MALSKVQRGELTNRLRNFFGLTGSYAADLDTTVSAVATVQNLDDPPFRQIGYRWFFSKVLAPVAGSYSRTVVFPQLNASAVLDQIIIRNNDTPNSVVVNFELVPSTGGVGSVGVVPEGVKIVGGAIVGGINGPVVASSADVVGPVPPLGAYPLLQLPVGALSLAVVPTQMVIQPGAELLIYPTTLAAPFALNLSGRWWPTAGA